MGERKRILLVMTDDNTVRLLERSVLSPEEYHVLAARSCEEAHRSVQTNHPDLMILGENLPDGDHLELAAQLLEKQPTLPIVLFTAEEDGLTPRDVVNLDLVDWLTPPLSIDKIRDAVQRGLGRSEHWQDWLKLDAARYTRPLLQRVDELETLAKVGRQVTGQLDLDAVLTAVVEAAVVLTGAEEASILLLDEESGELYMRAARNFQEDFVRTFRLAVDDTHAGQVIQSKQPVLINTDDPQKIMTAYLVHSLLYVPLISQDHAIGVLGVDNRESGKGFSEKHTKLLATLADYATIAIENAQLYSQTDHERTKLENILTQIEDGVIVISSEDDLILVNRMVRKAFNLGEKEVVGKKLADIFKNRDLLMAMHGQALDPQRVELKGEDNREYRVQVTNIPEIGTVGTIHDISYLKELDRIKTDFVNTVSHDIRSPLTSILGYVELIQRIGEVNDQQVECINKVQTSVHNITNLITDLLELGKTEGGLYEEFEMVGLSPIIAQSVDGLRPLITDKKQNLSLKLQDNLPKVFGNSIQLRQMFDNLIGNAVKYTEKGGKIGLTGSEEDEQIILQFTDTGRGIPLDDQAKIFDRFFRASNVSDSVSGTGLGLAITKSIVENHRGRIWVDSAEGRGSVFTVVLPAAEK